MSTQETGAANQPQEIQLRGMDPMVLLNHLGEGWSLAIQGNYEHPAHYLYHVKQGNYDSWKVDIDQWTLGTVRIQGPLVNETLAPITKATLLEGGNVTFSSPDGKESYTFENHRRAT